MATSYRVAVLGNQNDTENFFGGMYGINAYDLSVDQICKLLEKADIMKGIDYAELGAQPVMNYQVYGGGRFWPEVSREELAQVMQGVDVLIAIMPSTTFFFNGMSHEFYRCLLEENLMEKCNTVIVRIVNVDTSRYGQRNARDMKAETIMKGQGLDPTKLKEKLYVISDAGVAKKSKRSKGKKSKGTKQGGVEKDIADLRASLLGEELKETMTKPVKETVSAGKALLGAGQRLANWLGSLVRAN